MLQVLNRVERVLKRTREVVLHIIGRRTVVVRHHHDGVGIDIRIEVDRQPHEREQTKNDDRREHETGHNRSSDRTFI